MLKFKYLQKTLRKIYRYHEYFNAKTICNLRVFQNNKALKQTDGITYKLGGLRVLQNNKALKPQIRSKAHAAARLFCKISLPNLIRNVNRIANFA